jgi:hypothetical protein
MGGGCAVFVVFLFCEGRKGAILMLLPWFFSKLFARIKKKE